MSILPILFGTVGILACGPEDDLTSLAPKDLPPQPPPYVDLLAAPERPTIDAGVLGTAHECGACHKQHFQEWSTSPHANAMGDPVFRALVERSSRQVRFCTQCHSPVATRTGEIAPSSDLAADTGIIATYLGQRR